MSNFNCDNSPMYPGGVAGPIPPFWGFSAFTPTIPKLYWDVKSQEQRILNLFDLLNKLVCYCDNMGLQIDINSQDIVNLKKEIQELEDGSLFDYYEKLIYDWIQANMADLISAGIKQVYFGLEGDYFCAYIPDSWDDIVFDTGMVYGSEEYGRLILKWNTAGGNIDDIPEQPYADIQDIMNRLSAIDANLQRNNGTLYQPLGASVQLRKSVLEISDPLK